MSSQNEIYERIIDLSIKVVQGKLDPMDIDISKYLDLLRKQKMDLADIPKLYMDITALTGLVLILEAQYNRLKNSGLGLYIEPLLVRLKAKQLSLTSLSRIFLKCWHPSVNIQLSTNEMAREAAEYYNNLKPIDQRMFTLDGVPLDEKIASIDLIIPEELERMMDELLKELWSVSNGEWIDYYEFISRGEDHIQRAYILSFIVTNGWAEIKYRRFEDKIFLRPIKDVGEPSDTYSVTTELRGEGKDGET